MTTKHIDMYAQFQWFLTVITADNP